MMHKKTVFSILIILFLIPSLISATTLSIKGKSGYNLTINVLNPVNNESVLSSLLTADIGSSGQVNVDFSVTNAKANIITIARVNGKIVKKKEWYNVNVQTASPIIIDLLDTPLAPKPTPAPTPIVQNTTPPTSTPPPQPEPTPEPEENKSFISIIGQAISLESLKQLSPATQKIIIYASIGGIIVIAIIVFVIVFLIKRKKKTKFPSHEDFKDFKVTKLSSLAKESESEDDIEEAEKRLKTAREEITIINEILNKRRAIKEAERRLEEERKALERLKKGMK